MWPKAKTVNNDQKERIRPANTPGIAKRMGSATGYRGFRVALRADWEEIKLAVMERIVWEKFHQNPELGVRLIATGERALIEGNRWGDRWWGVDLKCNPPIGANWLGRLLMITRAKITLGKEIREAAEEVRTGQLPVEV